ncbi:hypothetical protein [Promicromonospora sukumoe]
MAKSRVPRFDPANGCLTFRRRSLEVDVSRFHEWFRRRATEAGWLRVTDFGNALASWEGFVEQCAEGYGFGVYEYNNDLHVRDLLELVFDNEADHLPGVEDARRRVAAVDKRFQQLLKPGVLVPGAAENWWSGAVPAKGGAELVEDFNDKYGIRIAVVQDC